MASDSPLNPYLAPQAKLEVQRYESCWRDGKTLVMQRDSELPHRCVKCNDEAASPLRKRSLIWHHPGWYVLLLLNFIIYLIAALIVRKRAKIEFGMCTQHIKRRQIVLAAAWGILCISVALGFWAANSEGDSPGTVVVAVIALLAAVLVGMFGFRMPYAKRITVDEIRVGGCGEAFLASLGSRSTY